MKMRNYKLITGLVAVLGIAMAGCDKTKPYSVDTPPAQVHFTNTAGSSSQYVAYFVTNDANSVYNVTVGTTNVVSSDRVVTYDVKSNSAVAGTQYSIAGGSTVTIPSGKATANIPLHGIFAGYSGTRRDTIIFTLKQPSLDPAGFMDTVRVVLQRYCDVVLANIGGAYTRTFEGTYGPYTSTVSNVVSTGTTKATATISNMYDNGITANNVLFDWSNPANFTVTIPEQNTGLVWSGYQVWIRTSTTGNTFSSCDNTISLRIDILGKTSAGVTAGYFEQGYSISMAK